MSSPNEENGLSPLPSHHVKHLLESASIVGAAIGRPMVPFTRAGGLLAPWQGQKSLHPTREVDERTKKQCPREAWGTKGCVPTGAMKIRKSRERKFAFSSDLFSYFPRMLSASGRRRSRRPARGCGRAAANSQWDNRYLQTGICVVLVFPEYQQETACSPGHPLPQLGPGYHPGPCQRIMAWVSSQPQRISF